MAAWLEERNIPVKYEQTTLTYTVPATQHKYTPDFELPDGTFIETKGYFDTEDRQKHLHVKASNPGVKIRFLFTRAHEPIYKGSKTTYAMWCDKHGYEWAEKTVPEAWIK